MDVLSKTILLLRRFKKDIIHYYLLADIRLRFLRIEMDPILVDVNVHPSKLEVRISKEQELNEFVAKTIKSAFKKQELIPDGIVKEKVKEKSEQTTLDLDHLSIPQMQH